jgi:cytochrome c oxidase subunit 2
MIQDLPGGPAVRQLGLTPAVTSIAHAQADLHVLMMYIVLAIFCLVFGVMMYTVIRHRRRPGRKAANFHESTTLEIAWTIIPFLIVIGMALPATKLVVAMKDTSSADLTIKATGHQWKWSYEYLRGPGEGIQFYSTLNRDHRIDADNGVLPDRSDYLLNVDNPLVVPVGKKIRIITTATDVIHSWMVPAFGVKQDAIPGFVRDTWFKADVPGTYYGQCTELCGQEHAFMPIVVTVMTVEDYAKWTEKTKLKGNE